MEENNTSRLVKNTEGIRNSLLSRNLYTPTNVYPLPPSEIGKVINTVDSIINIIAPFKGFALEDTVIGRAIDDKTPLVRIGLKMLGKQLAYNGMSSLAHEAYQIIKPSNLFDGDKSTSLFLKNSDYSITSKVEKNTFNSFLKKITSKHINSNNNPFNKESTESDYLLNTGSGQLDLLIKSLNRNLYISNDPKDQTLINLGEKIGSTIDPRYKLLFANNNTYFNFSQNPYISFVTSDNAEINANSNMTISYMNAEESQIGEYATRDVISKFGSTESKSKDNYNISKNTSDTTMNNWISVDGSTKSNDINNQLVWGRDLSEPNSYLPPLRGLENNQIDKINPQNIESSFGVSIGLLKHTQELLNATEGRIVDITRKAFTKGDKIVGFNGSGIWQSPSDSLVGKTTGLRQHTVLDQYNRYAKAIRFDGNKVYTGNTGNVNSVIYDTVMPRIHPIYKEGKYDPAGNKNLMFSLENLAIRVISKDTVGIIDDGEGSTIPISEVGQFNGRLMWFPPYNIEINETTTAKYESTVMVGRSEPIYSYQNSERSATLNFSLLIDYPPQLADSRYKGTDKNKNIAEFFAFGSNGVNKPSGSDPVKSIEENKLIIDGHNDEVPTQISVPEGGLIATISFPNDMPNKNQINNVFDLMYKDGYEVFNFVRSTDGSSWGLNNDIYNDYPVIELVPPEENYMGIDPNAPSQYIFSKDVHVNKLNQSLIDYFTNPENRKYLEIKIVAGASKLYEIPSKEKDYNEELGKRRADATRKLLEERIFGIFNESVEKLGIKISFDGDGSTGSLNAPSETELKENISKKETKLSRYATISVVRTTAPPEPKKITTSEDDKSIVKQTKITVQNEEDSYNKRRYDITDGIFKERATNGNHGNLLEGFQGISGNYYVPVFHSQTPEEFHRRLVFLQQCMRQGAAQLTADGKSIKNSVFGRQPICILRIGDFMYTKVIIETLTIDYTDTTWDMNPEGFGMQPMLAKITLQMKVIGGQSLKGPVDALQNAVSFNHYANSTFSNRGMYAKPSREADNQDQYINGIEGNVIMKKDESGKNTNEIKYGILLDERNKLNNK